MLTLLLVLAMAADGLKITEFQRDPIGVYDANGTLQYKKARKDLPKPPLEANPVDSGDFYSTKSLGGEILYFRSSDVVVTGKPPICVNAVRSAQKASETVAAASIGVSSNMGNVSIPCLHAQ